MKRYLLPLAPLIIACGGSFYYAPPSLEHFPQRSPTKRWQTLFQEAKPQPEGALPAHDLFQSCRILVRKLPDLTAAQRLEAIDALLQQNRDGDFRLNVANFLHELRELVAADVPFEQMKTYLDWRLTQLELPAGFISGPPERQWDWDDNAFAQAKEAYHKQIQSSLAACDGILKEGPKALHPYALVQRGAIQFSCGSFDDAGKDFTEVLTNFPEHPRAEVARLMMARTSLEQARTISKALRMQNAFEDPSVSDKLADANEQLTAYQEKYPKGRFLADAIGWRSAVLAESKNYQAAIVAQLERLDVQPTRETTRSVMRECDRLLHKMFAPQAADQSWEAYEGNEMVEALARHPIAARLFIQRMIDPAAEISLPLYWEDDSGSRNTIDFLRQRIIRPQERAHAMLVALGKKITSNSQGQISDPTSLLILGWASVGDGEHAQALALFDRALSQKRSDELLQGRAIALTRLQRYPEAVEAYLRLAQEFPDSILTTGSIFERAVVRFRAGNAGEALLDFWQIESISGGSEDNPSSQLHPGDETREWIDTLVQFAPVEQLRAPLATLPADDPRAQTLRSVIRCRALGREDFALAKQFLGPEIHPKQADENAQEQWEDDPDESINTREMFKIDLARWNAQIEPLARSTEQLKQAGNDKQKAAAHLQLAKQWRSLRGRVTMPLHACFTVANDEEERADLLRRQNARALGFPQEFTEQELDSRDELSHALQHFLAAANLTGEPSVTREALEGANEALFRLAEFSLYRASRAIETDANGLSTRLVERLRKEFPHSPEAKRAIAWSFQLPTFYGQWLPGNLPNWIIEENLPWHAKNPQQKDIYPEVDAKQGEELEQLEARLHHTLRDQTKDMAAYRAELATLHQEFEAMRAKIRAEHINTIADDLDDLRAASMVGGLSPDLFRRYAGIRQNRANLPEPNGEWQPLAPFLAFLDRIQRIEVENAPTRLKANTIESWQNYLQEFPNSAKSEAASLRLLRLKVRACCPLPRVSRFHFPESPTLGSYKRIAPRSAAHPADVEALLKELAAHEARYPGGRYAADIALLRAALAADQKNEALALRELVRVLDDPQHPELHTIAGRLLAERALKLLEPDARPALVAALRTDARARTKVRNMALADTCISRIRPILPWLEPIP